MIHSFTEWIFSNRAEVAGAILGILYVLLSVRQRILTWPVGLLTSLLYIIVFFNTRLYAAMTLQFYYVGISIYGWYYWLKGTKESNVKVRVKITKFILKVKLGLLTAIFYLIIFVFLKNYTDSDVPYFDAFTTSLSITATWMLARKYIENWIIWIIVDLVSIGLYSYKNLWPTVFLFTIYLIMAIFGFFEWKKEYLKES